MKIHVCVPVLKRYDLLAGMLQSLKKSTILPTMIYIIDNGRNETQIQQVIRYAPCKTVVQTPAIPWGVAKSWNWFLDNVPEERIIVNDDVIFGTHSLARLTAREEELVFSLDCGFSCFLIRDLCVEKLGKFDETISPGYGYYEDCDYLQRLDGKGTREASARSTTIDCGARHLKSQTLEASTVSEIQDHHRRFKIAQSNYMRKWNIASL